MLSKRTRSSLSTEDSSVSHLSRSHLKSSSPKSLLKHFAKINETLPPSQPDNASPTVTSMSLEQQAQRRVSRRSSGIVASQDTPRTVLRRFVTEAPLESPVRPSTTSESSTLLESSPVLMPQKLTSMISKDQSDYSGSQSDNEKDASIRRMPRSRKRMNLEEFSQETRDRYQNDQKDSGSRDEADRDTEHRKMKKIRKAITAEDIAFGIKHSQDDQKDSGSRDEADTYTEHRKRKKIRKTITAEDIAFGIKHSQDDQRNSSSQEEENVTIEHRKTKKIRNKITAEDIAIGIKHSQEAAAAATADKLHNIIDKDLEKEETMGIEKDLTQSEQNLSKRSSLKSSDTGNVSEASTKPNASEDESTSSSLPPTVTEHVTKNETAERSREKTLVSENNPKDELEKSIVSPNIPPSSTPLDDNKNTTQSKLDEVGRILLDESLKVLRDASKKELPSKKTERKSVSGTKTVTPRSGKESYMSTTLHSFQLTPESSRNLTDINTLLINTPKRVFMQNTNQPIDISYTNVPNVFKKLTVSLTDINSSGINRSITMASRNVLQSNKKVKSHEKFPMTEDVDSSVAVPGSQTHIARNKEQPPTAKYNYTFPESSPIRKHLRSSDSDSNSGSKKRSRGNSLSKRKEAISSDSSVTSDLSTKISKRSRSKRKSKELGSGRNATDSSADDSEVSSIPKEDICGLKEVTDDIASLIIEKIKHSNVLPSVKANLQEAEPQDEISVGTQEEIVIVSQDEIPVETEEITVETQEEITTETQVDCALGALGVTSVQTQNERQSKIQEEELAETLEKENRTDGERMSEQSLAKDEELVKTQGEEFLEMQNKEVVQKQCRELFVKKDKELVKKQDGESVETHSREPIQIEDDEPLETLSEELLESYSEGQSEVHSEGQSEVHSEGQSEVHSEGQSEVHSEGQSEVQSEAKSEVQSEAKSESQSEAKSESQIEAKSESQIEAKSESQIEAKSESQIEAKSESQIEAKSESQIEAKSESQIEAKSESQIGAKSESQIGAKSESQIEAKSESQIEAKSESQSEAKSESQIEAKSESQSEAKSESQSEAKSESQSEAKSESQSEAKSELQSEAKSELQSEAKSELQSEAKSESQSEAKSESQSEAKSESQSEAKSESQSEAQSESQSEAQSEAKSESQSEAKSESQSEVQSEAHSEVESEAHSEVESEAHSEVENETQDEDHNEAQSEEFIEAQSEEFVEAQSVELLESHSEAQSEVLSEESFETQNEETHGEEPLEKPSKEPLVIQAEEIKSRDKEAIEIQGENEAVDHFPSSSQKTSSSIHPLSSSLSSSVERDSSPKPSTSHEPEVLHALSKTPQNVDRLSHQRSSITRRDKLKVRRVNRRQSNKSLNKSKSYEMIDSLASSDDSLMASDQINSKNDNTQILSKSPYGSMRAVQKGSMVPDEVTELPVTQLPRVGRPTHTANTERVRKAVDKYTVPPRVTSLLVSHYSKLKIPTTCLDALGTISDEYFENLFSALTCYANHSKRTKIKAEDVELYFHRVGYVNKNKSLNTLIREYLSLQDQQLLIPVARANSTLTLDKSTKVNKSKSTKKRTTDSKLK